MTASNGAGDAVGDPGSVELRPVELRDLPVPLHARAQEHSADLQREFQLLAQQVEEEGPAGVPRRLLRLVEKLQRSYVGFSAEQSDRIDDAIERGLPTVDLRYHVPAQVLDALDALDRLLDEADDYCRAGDHLLTLATPDDLVAYRRWFFGEFRRQLAGEPPQPWRNGN